VSRSARVNRRVFLKTAMATGAVLSSGFAAHVAWSPCECGADIVAPHMPIDEGEAGGFCPNCGRVLRSGQFKLRDQGWQERPRPHVRSAGWNAAQVPFPNPRLVRATDKPRVVMAAVRV
jgi:hypothetical protein